MMRLKGVRKAFLLLGSELIAGAELVDITRQGKLWHTFRPTQPHGNGRRETDQHCDPANQPEAPVEAKPGG